MIVDPVLWLCLAQQWLIDNESDVASDGYERDNVVGSLTMDEADHELWRHFERVHIRRLRRVVPSPDVWGIGVSASPRASLPRTQPGWPPSWD